MGVAALVIRRVFLLEDYFGSVDDVETAGEVEGVDANVELEAFNATVHAHQVDGSGFGRFNHQLAVGGVDLQTEGGEVADGAVVLAGEAAFVGVDTVVVELQVTGLGRTVVVENNHHVGIIFGDGAGEFVVAGFGINGHCSTGPRAGVGFAGGFVPYVNVGH